MKQTKGEQRQQEHLNMNIKEDKEQIRGAMKAYFTKDELGNYAIPLERQRPVFLMGPPAINKTAVNSHLFSMKEFCDIFV